jgi:S1-C subfamily serine protease
MSNKILPVSLLTAALFAGGVIVPAQAGQGMGHGTHDQMSLLMAHHGFMKQHERQGNPAKLGVAIAEVPQTELDALSLEYGVRVEKVLQGSVAETAGLQPGDVVVSINDRPAYSPVRLQHLVKVAQGSSTITVSRNGESLKLDAAFAEPQTGNAVLGVRIQEMTDDLKEAFGSQGKAGVLISQVNDGSAAHQAGLKAGDVIVSLGKDEITSVHDVHAALGAYAPGDKVDMAFVRDRERRSMQIELGAASHASQSYAMHPYGMRGHGKGDHGKYGHGYQGHHGMMSKHGCGMHKGQRRS